MRNVKSVRQSAEIDIDNISDPGRVNDPALDDLKAADVVPGLGRLRIR